MFLLLLLLLISIILILVLKLVSFLISEKTVLIREEISSYECGFEHHNVSRVPFSLRYFFLTLIFLLFDLEIVLIIFIPFIVFSVNYFISIFILLAFVFILYLSLIYE
jgi:NADH-ubiquinone oxidoreductase chain 3